MSCQEGMGAHYLTSDRRGSGAVQRELSLEPRAQHRFRKSMWKSNELQKTLWSPGHRSLEVNQR